MDLFEEQIIIKRMEELKNKWPNPPEKLSREYWVYRADQNLWLLLKTKLRRLTSTSK